MYMHLLSAVCANINTDLYTRIGFRCVYFTSEIKLHAIRIIECMNGVVKQLSELRVRFVYHLNTRRLRMEP